MMGGLKEHQKRIMKNDFWNCHLNMKICEGSCLECVINHFFVKKIIINTC